MNQMPTSVDSTLLTVVLAVLAIGLPILIVLAIRFFWDRSLYLGRSKELEKLIWQLHRIASAMEHQLNVSFPSVQPGTEEATDLAYLERPAASQAKRAAAPSAPAHAAIPVTNPAAQAAAPAAVPQAYPPSPPQPSATPAVAPPSASNEPAQPQAAATPEQSEETTGFPPLVTRDPKEPPRHGGVNSMFGF